MDHAGLSLGTRPVRAQDARSSAASSFSNRFSRMCLKRAGSVRNIDEMTDERLEYLLSLERRTPDEAEELRAEWRRRLPELRRQTREALDAMDRLSRGRRAVRLW
jgi:hypothetical protein